MPAPLGEAPQLNASIKKLLDGVDAPAFPDEAYSVVAPMRDAQAPDTCRTSKGETTRLAACAYLCGDQLSGAPDALVGFHTGSYYHATDERGHPKAFRRGGRAHPIFSPHRAKVLHGPARGATLDDAHFVHFTGRYLCGYQTHGERAVKF